MTKSEKREPDFSYLIIFSLFWEERHVDKIIATK